MYYGIKKTNDIGTKYRNCGQSIKLPIEFIESTIPKIRIEIEFGRFKRFFLVKVT